MDDAKPGSTSGGCDFLRTAEPLGFIRVPQEVVNQVLRSDCGLDALLSPLICGRIVIRRPGLPKRRGS